MERIAAFLLAFALAGDDAREVTPGVPHPGGDQVYWTPTLAQAEEMARATGRPVFGIVYCANWDGY